MSHLFYDPPPLGNGDCLAGWRNLAKMQLLYHFLMVSTLRTADKMWPYSRKMNYPKTCCSDDSGVMGSLAPTPLSKSLLPSPCIRLHIRCTFAKAHCKILGSGLKSDTDGRHTRLRSPLDSLILLARKNTEPFRCYQ